MKRLALLLGFSFSLAAADLGVINSRRAVALDTGTTRTDFSQWIVEILPKRPPTNLVTLILTNHLLTASDLANVPDGPGLIGVRSIFKDGTESDLGLYRYDLRRERPPQPLLTVVGVPSEVEESKCLTNVLRTRHHPFFPPPPLPKDTNSSLRVESVDPRKRRNE